MNLCLFFEGTVQGVAGKITNVTRLRDICVEEGKLGRDPFGGGDFGLETAQSCKITEKK